MTDIVKINDRVSEKILKIRGKKIILDSDVALLYQVETKRINEAVNRNPEKFPTDYTIELTDIEKSELVANCDRFANLKYSTANPKGFTERGLYMLATILKSNRATETTLAIIDTFAQVREISRTIAELIDEPDETPKQKTLIQKTGELIGNLVMPDETDMRTVSVKTTTKVKFLSMIEITREVIKEPK